MWINVVHDGYLMDHLGTSWYILFAEAWSKKAATGAELRASSPTSPTTGAIGAMLMNSSTFWKHLHQTAYSTLAASSTKMNQCLHALHGCIVLLTFAICLCICQSIFTVSIGFGWTTKCSSTHRYSDHSASWLSFSGTPAATNPSKLLSPHRGQEGQAHSNFCSENCDHLV